MRTPRFVLHFLFAVFFITIQAAAAASSCHKDDLKALLDFKAGVTSTSGRLNTWKGNNCCSWATVGCNNKTGRVVSLKIEGAYDGGDFIGYDSMNGTISESLGKLSSLETLSLEGLTYLTGPIPASLGSISTLKGLFLDGNALTGSIPASLGSLSHLTRLFLSKNKLSGSIPAQLGSLKQLKDLGLDNNHLTGAIPASLGGLEKLQTLDASENQLTSNIPDSFGKLSKLTTLILSNNKLTGNIPSSLGGMTSLQELRLNSNLLSRSLPASLSSCKSLKHVSLSKNQLSGSIPAPWSGLVNVTTLSLSENRLTGEIPNSFTSLKRLETLEIAHNKLSGQVPDLSRNSQLSTLDLSFNKFVLRTIPGWLKTLKENYFRLSLASCGLETLPTFLSEMNLGYLDLSSNKLKGDVPELKRSLAGLFHLNLSSNPLSVTFTTRYANFSILNVLDMHATLLHGSVAPIFSDSLQMLEHVDLSDNGLTGKIPTPPSPSVIDNWSYLNLAKNKLEGSIPAEISNLVAMKDLDLSHNQLSGSIPGGFRGSCSSWGSWRSLICPVICCPAGSLAGRVSGVSQRRHLRTILTSVALRSPLADEPREAWLDAQI